jgi:dihydrofolate reductase
MPSLRNPLTLIVATTPVTSAQTGTKKTLLGIGKNGALPWPRIKSDMNFFARVTTRSPAETKLNAIIMGRKTYYSVPKSLRPLKDRLNVVITRDATGSVKDEVEKDVARQKGKDAEKGGDKIPKRNALVSGGLEDALTALAQRSTAGSGGDVENVFVIGGGEIYASSLRLSAGAGAFGAGLRILMTRVLKKQIASGEKDDEEFDCDTFFPLSDDDLNDAGKWREASATEVSRWVGEEVSPDWTDDGDVSIKMVGYERLS